MSKCRTYVVHAWLLSSFIPFLCSSPFLFHPLFSPIMCLNKPFICNFPIKDLRSTFYKLDDDHDGIVRRQDFQRLVDQLMFISTEEEFNKLMAALSISKKTRLNYQEFLDLFEVRDSAEGHKWLDSDHRWVVIIIIITFYLPRVATSVMKLLFQRALHNIIIII